jgi:two-component system, response regulator PdtaR
MPTRLLLVEDDPLIRMDLREDLQQLGYLVVGEAGDGQTGLTLARELRPDLVIMCIIMPEMDGLTAARILAAERIAPVMLLTALSDDEISARACDAGVAMYLTKPWRQSDLQPAIEVALARHREFIELERRVQLLQEELATRRIVERASGFLMAYEQLCAGDAFRRIRRLAMNMRASMREVNEAFLLGYDLVSNQTLQEGCRPLLEEVVAQYVTRRRGERGVERAEGVAAPSEPVHAEPAEQRAEALLSEFLTEAERRQLAQEGYIETPSTLMPGRCYRIPRSGRSPLVYEHGRPVYRLCVGPVEPLPSADLVLCHLLLIRSDEMHYLATANRLPT